MCFSYSETDENGLKNTLGLTETLTELHIGGELQYFTKFKWLKIKIKSLGDNDTHA